MAPSAARAPSTMLFTASPMGLRCCRSRGRAPAAYPINHPSAKMTIATHVVALGIPMVKALPEQLQQQKPSALWAQGPVWSSTKLASQAWLRPHYHHWALSSNLEAGENKPANDICA